MSFRRISGVIPGLESIELRRGGASGRHGFLVVHHIVQLADFPFDAAGVIIGVIGPLNPVAAATAVAGAAFAVEPWPHRGMFKSGNVLFTGLKHEGGEDDARENGAPEQSFSCHTPY